MSVVNAVWSDLSLAKLFSFDSASSIYGCDQTHQKYGNRAWTERLTGRRQITGECKRQTTAGGAQELPSTWSPGHTRGETSGPHQNVPVFIQKRLGVCLGGNPETSRR